MTARWREIAVVDGRSMGFPRAPLIVLGVWLAMVAAFVIIVPASYDGPRLCMFRNVTGVPCPTCGSTRAVLALGRGDITAAMHTSPLVVASFLIGVMWLIGRSALPKHTIAVTVALSQNGGWALLAALALNWIYVIARGTG